MRLNAANILVVDDEPALCHLFKKWLMGLGCRTVHTAGDGEAALAVLRSTAIDLVVTDVNMPVMDGVALVRCIAQTAKYVPSIVFVSGYGDVDKREMYGLGVEAFVTKPFEHGELLAVLEDSLAERSALWLSAMAGVPRQSISIRVKEIAEEAREGAICLGRGGFSAVSDLPLNLGKIAFDCSFEDGRGEMSGQGYVRWHSRTDQRVGIEFAHLHAACHPWVVKEVANRASRSYIPRA